MYGDGRLAQMLYIQENEKRRADHILIKDCGCAMLSSTRYIDAVKSCKAMKLFIEYMVHHADDTNAH